MASVAPPSQSPQVSTRTTPPLPAHVTAPFTPIHSPHHSVASSVSYRTPVHTLSIHEYRKQQHTPSSGVGTPVGRTLRRKAAAPALNTIERVPSTGNVNKPSLRPVLRPLQPSQSAQQLYSYQSSLQFQTPPDQLFRTQSAEPRTHFGSTSTISTSSVKERHFNSRKRLPRPTITTGPSAPYLQSAVARPHIPHQSPRPVVLDIGRESSHSSDARTTPTASTFSLSRFPPPPNFRESPDSVPSKDNEVRKTTHPFAPQRPVTPPATPATIHYRGASFDLVNPHDSLVLHDIVTPSKDFGSSEYLVAPIAVEPLVVSSEMAPKRALYGDLNSAHASITGRAEDSLVSSDLDLPLPPTPAAVSPESSSYTSPVYSPQSRFAPAPLVVNNASTDSRFSIKSLTRSLTRRLTKAQDSQDGQELQDLHDPYAPTKATGPVGNPSRSFKNVYISSPQPAYYPLNPTSPTTPQSETFQQDPHLVHDDDEMDYQENDHPERVLSEPLASMIPDEHSTQIGRAETSRMSYSSPDFIGRSYYGDTESIYPSSSIYSGQDRRRSAYQQSVLSDPRHSRFYSHYGSTNANDLARVYSPEDFSDSFEYDERERHAGSSNVQQESVSNSEEKVDTISKIIDQYNPHTTISQPVSEVQSERTESIGTDQYTLAPQVENSAPAVTRSFIANDPSEPFSSGWQEEPVRNQQFGAPDTTRPSFAVETAAWRRIAGPPAHAAPLAPPFEYDGPPFGVMRGEQSDVFSRQSYSSYGDTRHLLQIPQTNPDFSGANATLQPSSSYSQPTPIRTDLSSPYAPAVGDRSPRTPQEALDEAEKIFEDMSLQKDKPTPEPIPAIWTKRHSGSLLPSANFVDRSDNLPESPRSFNDGNNPAGNASDGDWESIAGGSRGARDSLGSIADYSSTDSTRNSLGLSLASSPPVPARIPGAVSSPLSPSRRGPLYAETEAAAISRSHPGDFPHMGGEKQHYTPSPWSNLYAFSDKETQELLASGPNDKIMVEHGGSRDSVDLRDTTNELNSGDATEKSYMDNLKGNMRGVTGNLGIHGARRTVNPITSPELASFSKSGLPQSPTSPFSMAMSPTGLSEKDFGSQGGSSRRASMRPALRLSTAAFHRSDRRASRTSVAGQTKLREMMLSPDRKTLSSQDTNFSQFMANSQRPSTADTNTPLHAPPTLDLPASPRTVIAHQHSPHLLCPERAVNPEDEERRRKLSWMILACFCLLPPCIILYRLWGDSIIASLTEGKLGHCTRRSKNVALVAGIAINIGVAAIIVVVIVVTHALGAV